MFSEADSYYFNDIFLQNYGCLENNDPVIKELEKRLLSITSKLDDKDPFEIEMENWLGELLDEPTVPAGKTVGRSNFEGYGPKCECGSDATKTPLHSTWCPKFKKF